MSSACATIAGARGNRRQRPSAQQSKWFATIGSQPRSGFEKTRRQILRLILIATLVSGFAEAQIANFVRSPIQVARNFDRAPLPLNVNATAYGDDYLWVAADEGLYRFDGEHFHLIDKKPASSVAVTTDGWVWRGGNEGLVAFRKGEARKISSRPVLGIVARRNEVLVNSDGLQRGTIEGISPVGVSPNGPLTLDGNGRAWFGCGLEACVLDLAGNLTRLGSALAIPSETWLGAVADDSGTIWLWNGQKRVSVQNGRATVWAEGTYNASSDDRFEAFRSMNGRIWLAGVNWIEGGKYFVGEGGTAVGFRPFSTEDRFGNIWVGGHEIGLSLLAPRTWGRVWRGDPFPAGSEAIVRTKSGRLLAATPTGISEFDPKEQRWNRLAGKLGNGHAWSAVEGVNGDLWAVVQDVGIFRVDARTQEITSAFEGSMKDLDFRVLLRDQAGRIWVGAKRGLYRIRESVPSGVSQVPLPGNLSYAAAFATDSSGQEWLGYEGGIARLEGEQWTLVVPESMLLSPRIRSIAVSSGPVFWVSYRAPLPLSTVYRDGTKWTRRDFPVGGSFPSAETTAILVDRRGWIWRGTDQGLFVSDGRNLAPEAWLRFDRFNGLASDSVGPFGLSEDRDGSIWISTEEGVARIQPDVSWFGASTTQAPPRMTAIRAGGKEYLWLGTQNKLPVASSIDIDFAQWPDATPRSQVFQIRLWPVDKEWKTTSETTARYTGLSPGNYRFEVRSSNLSQSYELQMGPGGGFPWWWPVGGAAGAFGLGWSWRQWKRSRLAREYWDEKESGT